MDAFDDIEWPESSVVEHTRRMFTDFIVGSCNYRPEMHRAYHPYGWHLIEMASDGGKAWMTFMNHTPLIGINRNDRTQYLGPHIVKVTVEALEGGEVVEF